MLIVAGLYSVLWGKYKEYKEKEIEELIIHEQVKGINGNNKMISLENINNDIELQKNYENKIPIPEIAVSVSKF